MPELTTLEEAYRNMKNGFYNFTDNGKCTQCGNCCTALLPMTAEELKTLKRYVHKKHIRIVKHENLEGNTLDLTCPFRNDEKRKCMVYEVRPQICRDFKCDKPQQQIDKTKAEFEYNDSFITHYLRTIFTE